MLGRHRKVTLGPILPFTKVTKEREVNISLFYLNESLFYCKTRTKFSPGQ